MSFSFFPWFFTLQCPVCYDWQENSNICYKCYSKFSFLNSACKKCQQPFDFQVFGVDICFKCEDKDFFNSMNCVFVYSQEVKNLVVRFKNHNDMVLASLFSSFVFNKIKNIVDKDVIIVPVPLFKQRLIKRGYNQSFIIAKKVASLANVSCVHLLKRVRNTNSQALKTIQERIENVKNAFDVEEKYSTFIKGKKFILIDDVITTGATVYECAKILKKYGAKQIDIAAISRRIKK